MPIELEQMVTYGKRWCEGIFGEGKVKVKIWWEPYDMGVRNLLCVEGICCLDIWNNSVMEEKNETPITILEKQVKDFKHYKNEIWC